MVPNVAPCGTPAAYRRHLRHGEDPCSACRRANRIVKRSQADQRRRAQVSGPAPDGPAPAAAPVPVPAPASAPTGPPSAAADLLAARDALVAAIGLVAVHDPARLPGLVRELRETWKALRDLDAAPSPAPAEDEFAAARRRRAAAAGRS